jgi:hypothetical protein
MPAARRAKARVEPAPEREEIARRARARRTAEWQRSKSDLGLFIELSTLEYERPDHLAPLLDALDRMLREPVWLLLETPPQHAKTESLLHHAVRLLKFYGQSDVAYCSYSTPFALRKSRKAREIASRAGIWITDEERKKTRFDAASAVSYWQTIDGGSFTAGGRNSGFTGGGYDLALCDDLLKNREEAESPVHQEKAIETVRSTFANRINPMGSMVVSNQPWNDLDPIAQLKAEKTGAHGQAWELVSLPAVVGATYDKTTGELIGGVPLWPARYTLERLATIKQRVGTYNWFSQYTLDRMPRGDRPFREPTRYLEPQIQGAIVLGSVDPGIDDDEMKDSSGIIIGACYRKPTRRHTHAEPEYAVHVDVIFAADEWRTTPDLLDYLEALAATDYPGLSYLLEEVSAFKVISQVARRLSKRVRLYPVIPRGNKLLRSIPTSEAWNEGRIRVPFAAPWDVAGFIREAQLFTGKAGGKDNRVDALTQLYDWAEKALAGFVEAETAGETTMGASPF